MPWLKTPCGIAIEKAEGVHGLSVRLSDAMLDLDKPVSIRQGASTLASARVPRTIATLACTLEERGGPSMLCAGEVTVDLP